MIYLIMTVVITLILVSFTGIVTQKPMTFGIQDKRDIGLYKAAPIRSYKTNRMTKESNNKKTTTSINNSTIMTIVGVIVVISLLSAGPVGLVFLFILYTRVYLPMKKSRKR